MRESISFKHAHSLPEGHERDQSAGFIDVSHAYNQRSETPARKRQKLEPPSSSGKSTSSHSSVILKELDMAERNICLRLYNLILSLGEFQLCSLEPKSIVYYSTPILQAYLPDGLRARTVFGSTSCRHEATRR